MLRRIDLISDYTVMVTGFAPSTTEDDVRTHFNQLASKNKLNVVADVVFAYNNRSEIVLFKRRGDLVRKKKHLTFVSRRCECQRYLRVSSPMLLTGVSAQIHPTEA